MIPKLLDLNFLNPGLSLNPGVISMARVGLKMSASTENIIQNVSQAYRAKQTRKLIVDSWPQS